MTADTSDGEHYAATWADELKTNHQQQSSIDIYCHINCLIIIIIVICICYFSIFILRQMVGFGVNASRCGAMMTKRHVKNLCANNLIAVEQRIASCEMFTFCSAENEYQLFLVGTMQTMASRVTWMLWITVRMLRWTRAKVRKTTRKRANKVENERKNNATNVSSDSDKRISCHIGCMCVCFVSSCMNSVVLTNFNSYFSKN